MGDIKPMQLNEVVQGPFKVPAYQNEGDFHDKK